jgi:hypothetical protein
MALRFHQDCLCPAGAAGLSPAFRKCLAPVNAKTSFPSCGAKWTGWRGSLAPLQGASPGWMVPGVETPYVFSVISQSSLPSSSSFVLAVFAWDELNPVGCLFLSPFLKPIAPITSHED